MKKKILGVIAFLSMMFILMGCGQNLGQADVYLGGTITEAGETIVIEGESNLLPGSRVLGEVWVSEDELFSDVTELVDEKGRFQMELDHHKYGDAEVVVTFQLTDVQEEEIIEHYGELGENLEGPYIYQHEHWGDVRNKAVARVLLSQNDEASQYEFKEPTWNERPDDYGDPRVWIEVDEITNDEDYFYLNGTSNLLEGSEIRGYYASNLRDGKTRIKPDGTFELKVPYEYAEEAQHRIEFRPSYSQWQTIRDQYGINGEKLVGNLVETNGGSQFVQLEIE